MNRANTPHISGAALNRATTRTLAWTMILCAALRFAEVPVQAATRPLNVLIIHTDEHNYRTLGCYRKLLPPDQAFVWGPGVAVETPNIDWIADHGALAMRCFATSPVCTPSRASFLSGLYPQNTGAIRNNLPMRDDVVTFAEVLRRRGYATGYAGKWHDDGPAKPGWAPKRKFGFEDNRYMFNRGHWKQLEDTPNGPRVKARNAKGQPSYAVAGADEKSFTTDFLADKAVAFIRAHRNEPFCFMLSIPDPHGPNSVRPPYDTMFDHLKFQQPRTALEKGYDLPSYASVQKDKFNARQMALYFGMVKCIDDNVGKLLKVLRETGLLERTIVVFTSDHGDLCGEHGRHNKGVPLDTSAAIPFVIHAPGLIPTGTVVRQALGTVDFKPTLLGLLGVKDTSRTEGRDASLLFRTGRAPADWNDITFSRIGVPAAAGNGWAAALTSRYKFIVAPKDAPGLFDLQTDPFEMTNRLRSPAHRDVLRRLGKALKKYCIHYHEPHYENSAVQADLEWAAGNSATYVAPPRPLSAAPNKARGTGKRKAGKSNLKP